MTDGFVFDMMMDAMYPSQFSSMCVVSILCCYMLSFKDGKGFQACAKHIEEL